MRWLLNKNPLFFAVFYFLVIICFAGAYCILPNQFYQSTRNYEKYESGNKIQKDDLSFEIFKEIEIGLKERFKNKFKDSFVVMDNYSLYLENIWLTDFKYENGFFKIKIKALPYNLAHLKIISLELTINLDDPLNEIDEFGASFKKVECKIIKGDIESANFVINALFYPGNLKDGCFFLKYGAILLDTNVAGTGTQNTTEVSTISTDGSTTPPIKGYKYYDDSLILSQLTPGMDGDMKFSVKRKIFFDKILPNQIVSGFPTAGADTHMGLIFPISKRLNNNLKSLALGLTNDPKTLKGKIELFQKMLYFSIITIATLGYGDIVPLTPLARFLVSAEVVLGILIVGLFLNSIAIKISKKENYT